MSKLETVLPAGLGEKPKRAAPRRRWWLGTLPGCPQRNVTLGGISFNARTGAEATRIGSVNNLTDEQVEKIFKAMSNKVARYVGGSRPEIADIRVKGFVEEEGDEPLAKYLFMMPEEKAHLISGKADWAHTGGAPSVLEMLKRGDEEDDWCIGLQPTAGEKANAEKDEERKQLEERLKKAEAELSELRASAGAGGELPTADDRAREMQGNTVEQLRAYAESNGYEVPKDAKKAEIISAIVTAEQEAGLTAE